MTVYIHCPCADEDENINELATMSKTLEKGLKSQYARHFLHNLYFCEECLSIRCPRCISTEVVSWYCPTCLFTTGPSKLGNVESQVPPQYCPRRCYNCPSCHIHMGVTVIDGKRTLQCPFCKWCPPKHTTTKDDDIAEWYKQLAQGYNNVYDDGDFLFTTSTTTRDEEQQQHPVMVQTHEQQLESQYYPGYQSPNLPTKVTPLGEKLRRLQLRHVLDSSSPKSDKLDTGETILLGNDNSPKSSGGGFTNYHGQSPLQARYARIAQEHHHVVEGEYDDELAVRLLDQPEKDNDNDKNNNSQRRPLKQKMRAKYVKRCKVCRQCLVRPEAKGSSCKFRIKQMAMSVVPWISANTTGDNNNKIWITLTNPLFEYVAVRLSTPANGSFTILCPTFELGPAPCQEENTGTSLARAIRNDFHGGSNNFNQDIVKGDDWMSVAVAYQPNNNNNNGNEPIEMPLFVSLTYKANDLETTTTITSQQQDKIHEVGLWVLVELNVD